MRYIIQREKTLTLYEKPFMLSDGSLPFDGMRTLESMWRMKATHKELPALHILNETLAINSRYSACEDDTFLFYLNKNFLDKLTSEKPTFFIFFEENLHWLNCIAYKKNGELHLLIFDPAPLKEFSWFYEVKKKVEEVKVVYYRNEVLYHSTGKKEVSHLATDSGCGVLALHYAHELISLYGNFSLEQITERLSMNEASSYEKKFGVNFSFSLPECLSHLSHLSVAHLSASEVVQARKRMDLSLAPHNTTLKYFVDKSYGLLNDYIESFEQKLTWLNVYFDENKDRFERNKVLLIDCLSIAYYENPAFLMITNSSGVEEKIVLPLEKDEFEQLQLHQNDKEKAKKEYYRNKYHSAFRYFINSWCDVSSSIGLDLHASTKKPFDFIMLLFLIADEKVIVKIKGNSLKVSKEALVDVLASLSRKNNQLSTHFSTRQDELLLSDNNNPDFPANYFEAIKDLMGIVENFPLFKSFRMRLQEDVMDFVYHWLKNKIFSSTIGKKIVDSQPLNEEEQIQLKTIPISEEQIKELFLTLKEKYKEKFAWDSEFFIRKQLRLKQGETYFTKWSASAFVNRYLEEMSQDIKSTNAIRFHGLNRAHVLFNGYLQLPSALHGVIKDEMTKIKGIERAFALLLVAFLENNESEKRKYFEEMKAVSQEDTVELFECSESEIATAILLKDEQQLQFANRMISAFIKEHKLLLSNALDSLHLINDASQHRQLQSVISSSAVFFARSPNENGLVLEDPSENISVEGLEPAAKRFCFR